MFVEAVVDTPGSRGSTFFYSAPDVSEGARGAPLRIGQVIAVPFGALRAQAVIVGLSAIAPVVPTRPIDAILDPLPVLSEAHVALARWIAAYYRCGLLDAVKLMVPEGVKRRPEIVIRRRESAEGSAARLGTRERALYEVVRARQAVVIGRDSAPLRALGSPTQVQRAVRRLVELGLVERDARLAETRVRPLIEEYVSLSGTREEAVAALAQLQRAPRQKHAIEFLIAQRDARPDAAVPRAVLREAVGAGQAVIAALAEKGLIRSEAREIQRGPLTLRSFPAGAPPTLTAAQRAALDQIVAALDAPDRKPFLLHGVTGSGKTEIYLRLIAAAIARGRRAIVLVPEIALTPQTIHRFASRFPGRVAVLHSQLGAGERFDEWRRIREGQVDVVVGSRSALFAPLPRLGVIVVDEEQDRSYKSGRTPRYHAREAALKLAGLTDAVVVLGSATPDLGSYERSERGEIRRIELPERVDLARAAVAGVTPTRAMLPPVELVDLRAELRAGNHSIFSSQLKNAVDLALGLREQVILFLNRRGDSTFVLCRDCGFVLRCRRCEVPFVYHSAEEELVCHLCNGRTANPNGCPSCWGEHIRYFGIGTQKLEQETKRAFPNARVVRWDSDSARQRGAHERILNQFINREADILVGTQMIAKGIDLPGVTLVGVVSADTSLHLPDFRAAEHTFQLLTQVAGRAGRGLLGGRVIVQAYTPEHYSVQCASRHDYASFYAQEMIFRREQEYPPVSRLARLIHVGYGPQRVEAEARALAAQLRLRIRQNGLTDVEILGPAPAFHRKVRGRYRWQIILRGQRTGDLLSLIDLPSGWVVDVDPVSTL